MSSCHRLSVLIVLGAAVLALSACGSSGGDAGSASSGGGGGGSTTASHWPAIRAATRLEVALTSEYGTPVIQPVSTDGWEDGIAISRDGLRLYCTYVPADLLTFTVDGADQHQAARYLRGPTFGMDLHSNPAGTTTWIQSDILCATRASLAEPFTTWATTAMARPVWSEGGVVVQGSSTAGWDLFVYTANEQGPDYQPHIFLAKGVGPDPGTVGTKLPAPVTTGTAEDNPHIERLDASHLVLFFDSGERPGGRGIHDLWYATSADDGTSWTTPLLVTSISTPGDEHQPHLWRDAGGIWWLWFTATNPADSKLGIFRTRQGTPGDWDSWGPRELVIGAGNSEGIGEPTLTADGDLSFVVITKDPAGSATDRLDGDPWFLPRLPHGVAVKPRPAAGQGLALIGP